MTYVFALLSVFLFVALRAYAGWCHARETRERVPVRVARPQDRRPVSRDEWR